jgi:hypothetical protein
MAHAILFPRAPTAAERGAMKGKKPVSWPTVIIFLPSHTRKSVSQLMSAISFKVSFDQSINFIDKL